MISPELINYIKSELEQGKSLEIIEADLISKGHPLQDVQAAFGQIGNQANPANVSKSFFRFFKLSIPLVIGLVVTLIGTGAVLGYWGYISIFTGKSTVKNNPTRIPSISPTPSPTVTNCGSSEMTIENEGFKVNGQVSLQCMMVNAKTCNIAKIVFVGKLNIFGVKQTSTLNYEIRKNHNDCILQLKQGAIDIEFPTETPEEGEKAILDLYKKLENTSGVCIYKDTNDLVEIFENYLKGKFSASTRFEDSIYNKGECSGKYFDLVYPFHNPSATTETPLGSEAKAQSFSIKVTNVILNPNTTGDSPDDGMEYLEVDLSVTNMSPQKVFIPGEFYYLTSSGKLHPKADTFGNEAPGKNVQIIGMKSFLGTLDPGETDNSRSIIFQIPKGDKGKLIWYATSLLVTENAAKLAIFKLF